MIEDDYINFTIARQKHIALIAHDTKKHELVEWVEKNKDILKSHFLCGTGTTARLIVDKTGLPVKAYNSGPLGGDLQIGSRIVEGNIDFVIFFWDPLASQPHDPTPPGRNRHSFAHSQMPVRRRAQPLQLRPKLAPRPPANTPDEESAGDEDTAPMKAIGSLSIFT